MVTPLIMQEFNRPGAYLYAILLSLLLLGVYFASFSGGFFSDDYVYLVENKILHNIAWYRLDQFLLNRLNPYEYLPLRDLSYRLELALFGLNPLAFKLVNFVLYLLSCALVYCAVYLFLRNAQINQVLDKDDAQMPCRLALLSTTLFAFLPVHVEAVAWIASRKDVLALLFVMASLVFLNLFVEREKTKYLAISVLFYACALMSKLSVLVFPVVVALVLLLLWRGKGAAKHKYVTILLLSLPFFLLSGIFYAIATLQAAETGVALATTELNDERGGFLLFLKILASALKSLLPWGHKLVYDELFSTVNSLSWIYALFGGALLLLSFYAFYLCVARRSVVGFGVVAALVMLLPYGQLLAFRTWSPFSDRFMLIPSFFILLSLVVLIYRLSRRKAVILGSAIGLVFILATAVRAMDWSSVDNLLRDNTDKSLGSVISQELYIREVALARGDYTSAQHALEKIKDPNFRRYFEVLVQVKNPLNTLTAVDLQGLYAAQAAWFKRVNHIYALEMAELCVLHKVWSCAEAIYSNAVKRVPSAMRPLVNNELSLVYEKQAKYAQAVEPLLRNLEHINRPAIQSDIHNRLAILYKKMGQYELAVKAFKDALGYEGQWQAAINLARLVSARNRGEALKYYELGLKRASIQGASTGAIERELLMFRQTSVSK